MAVSITYDETRTILPDDGGFQITWDVTATTDIPTEIFVINSLNNEFSRVATVGDFEFPTTPDPKASVFHRVSTVVAVYDDIATAQKQQTLVRADIASLATEYQTKYLAFVGTDTITVP